MKPSNALKTSFFNLIKADTPFLALYTVTPTATGGGTEVTGGSYSRKAIVFGTPNLATGVMANSGAITFAGMPTVNITHYGILNAATGGTLKAFGTVASISTLTGDEVSIAIGNLTITFAGS